MVSAMPGTGIRWLVLLLSLLSAGAASAALTLRVDRNPVAVDESFTLTVESGGKVTGQPDFSVLEADFDILGQRQSSSFNMINGRTSQSIRWQVTLAPKRAGELTIPPISVGSERTPTARLTVSAAPRAAVSGGAGEDLFLEVTAEPREPYVQQQVIYTARVYLATDSGIDIVNGSSLSNPGISGADAVLERLGDDTQFETTHNGRRYQVIERRFAIYPQKSGQFTIDPILFDGRIVEGRRGVSPFFRQATRIKRLRSDDIALQVKPVPADFQGAIWLPAKSVKLMEEWSGNADGLVAGEPVTRTLALMVDGLTSAQIPAIDAQAPQSIKQYPDQPMLNDTKSASGISGVRQQKIALVPTGPGTLTLPPVEVAWWNTVTGKQEIARLPARTLEVSPAAGTAVPTQAPAQDVPVAAEGKSPDTAIAVVPAGAAGNVTNWWPWVSLALGLGWMITLLAWWRHGKKKTALRPADKGAERSGPARRELRRACREADPRQAKAALLEWGKHMWPQSPPASLGAIAGRVDAPLAEALDDLSRALYGKTAGSWDGEALWRAFQHHRPQAVRTRPKHAALLPLREEA